MSLTQPFSQGQRNRIGFALHPFGAFGIIVSLRFPLDPSSLRYYNDMIAYGARRTIPGVDVIHLDMGGKVRHYKGQAAITNMKDGKETSDAHGIAA
jgi:hypothetical protein